MLHELNHSDLLIKFGRKKNVKVLLCVILEKWLMLQLHNTLSEYNSNATIKV